MTEDEAKTKWCPFVRYLHETSFSYPLSNREARLQAPEGSTSRCIASACMAWRLKSVSLTDDKIAAIKRYRQEHPGTDLLAAKNAVEASWAPDGPHGYCGLAGAPS